MKTVQLNWRGINKCYYYYYNNNDKEDCSLALGIKGALSAVC